MVSKNAINIAKRTMIAIVLAIMFSKHPFFLTHCCKILLWTFGLENKN